MVTLRQKSQLGRWLRSARVRQGFTQKQLAQRSAISQPRVSGIERGDILPTYPQLLRLAGALAVPLQWFLNGDTVPGAAVPDLAIELQALGIADLLVPSAVVPGAFRPIEQVIALAVAGDQPETRIVEAIPAVLAWSRWSHTILRAYSQVSDPRAGFRLAWLADLLLAVQRTQGFPGGCLQPRELELFTKWWAKRLAAAHPDDLGRPTLTDESPHPLWKRWKIRYASPLSAFIERAEHLRVLSAGQPPRASR